MRWRHALLVAVGTVAGAAPAARAQPVAFQALEAYGTVEAAGVVATVSGDGNGDATATLEWRLAGAAAFRAAQPLARISPTTFAGSLFWLSPATSYEVRVTLADASDGVSGVAQRTATFATRADGLPEPTLRTLYVAPGGDDARDGTDPALPLRTIQRAADLVQAGDLVSIAPGTYRESVQVLASGTPAQPIVFRGSAPGVVLDGADAAIASGAVTWTAEGNGVYATPLAFPTGHVVTDLGRLYRYGSLADLQALPAGAPGGFWFDGTTLHLKLAGGGSPAARQVHVARLEDGILVDGQHDVRIEDVEIRHYGSGDYGKGVYLRYADDCAVRGARIHEVESAGVWIKGGSRNLVEDNEIWDSSVFGWPWDWSKGSSAEDDAILLTDDVGRGTVIRRNRVHGTFDGMGPCGDLAPSGGETTSETDVYDNQLYQHADDALEVEGWCANLRLWRNTITDSHMAFAVAPAAPGPTWIVRNVAYDFGNSRTSQLDGYLASALKINSGYATPVGPVFLYHDTLVTTAPSTDAMALLDPGASTYVRARDNVIAGTRYALYKESPVTLDWNADDLWTSDGSRYAWWLGAHLDDLATLRGGTGQELQGIAVAPALEDPANGRFRPLAGSPLVDGGVSLPGIDDVFSGSAPDLGAIEWDDILRDGFESGDLGGWPAHRS